MPQMMPLNWMILYTLFIMSLLMFNFINYYLVNLTKNTKINNYMSIKNTNWKW
uniref:ATP synthase F0 subunit 8 n=1 Tax=Eupolyphaga nigrinotum TaxID=2972403 RepID=UPI002E777BA1|nr:ATP synthase F0 subunit 8 [Eupolyphaga nigrinotum]WPM91819.1 ATP synthase F0 subunit 8 [Eupolyphaga nigrinotum]